MIDPKIFLGERINDRYVLSSYLGQGLLGWRFAADDSVAGEACEITLMRPETDAERVTALDELHLLGAIAHPRLLAFRGAGVVAGGDLEGCLYRVTEAGEHALVDYLGDGFRPRAMAADQVMRLARHVCEGLAYLHAIGLVHGKVEADNIFWVDDGWKLGEFALPREGDARFRAASALRLSWVPHLSIDVLQDDVGPWTDMWALGGVVHACLSGRFPYSASTEFGMVAQVMDLEGQIADGLPRPLDTFVRRSLERNRHLRWSAAEALAHLENPQSPAPSASSDAAPSPSPLPSGLRPLGKNAQGFEEAENEKDGTVLIHIPAGTFSMGADEHPWERPRHQVTVGGFWMAKTPVTSGQYLRFLAETGYVSLDEFPDRVKEQQDHPAFYLSWIEAQAYAKWAGLRLPTEAEWEYAARGTDERAYPWGNNWDPTRCRNAVGRSSGKPSPVGAYPQGASPFGCLDMTGTVTQWCSTVYAPYPYRADDGREGLQEDREAHFTRVRRGRAGSTQIADYRCPRRNFTRMEERNHDSGLRCARGLVASPSLFYVSLRAPSSRRLGASAPPVVGPERLIGEEIDRRYRLTSFLGEGAFGWTFAADDAKAGDGRVACVVKVVQPRSDSEHEAISHEIRALSALRHPRLLTFLEAGQVEGGVLDGCLYVVTERADQSLADLLHRHRLEPMQRDEAFFIALHVSEALAYIHEKRAVHRHLTPSNIFRVGNGWKVGDVGLVRGVYGTTATVSGARRMPLYVCPESLSASEADSDFALSSQALGSRMDVWALGAVVQQCLVGWLPYLLPRRVFVNGKPRRLYKADTEHGVLARMVRNEPKAPDNLPPEVARAMKEFGFLEPIAPVVARKLEQTFQAFVAGALERARQRRWSSESAYRYLKSQTPPPHLPNAEWRSMTCDEASTLLTLGLAEASRPSVPLPAGVRYLGKNVQGFDEVENLQDSTVLVHIPFGAYQMGSEVEANETPAHEVSVGAFWMAKHPVTNAQYGRFARATGHKTAGFMQRWGRDFEGAPPSDTDYWEEHVHQNGKQAPVVCVTWHDAVAYAKWAGLRLPTEAEWEYAARGTTGWAYPWGNAWDASRCQNGVGESVECPSLISAFIDDASPFGCLDMAGNVQEWCSSAYMPYPYQSGDGRESEYALAAKTAGVPLLGGLVKRVLKIFAVEKRVLRGGSWYHKHPTDFRASRRTACFSDAMTWVGIRCARSV